MRLPKGRLAALVLAAVVGGGGVIIGVSGTTDAVVNQVSGLVVPIMTGYPYGSSQCPTSGSYTTCCPGSIDRCLQTGLNFGEGQNPPHINPTNYVHAILDANTGPETFLIPKVSASGGDGGVVTDAGSGSKYATVVFRLLQEGAGYENIFGWYNVGDSSTRFPVLLSCANNLKSTYEPPAYSTGSNPKLGAPYTATVDFQKEYTKGRYKGGLVGFYLLTPEGSTNGGSTPPPVTYAWGCATDPYDKDNIDDDYSGSSSDDTAGYGRVYYTEARLNNDGNYVHYLVYQSKQYLAGTTTPKYFYFAFEDLFRGGDNDYDDTLVQVEGLIPTCQPKQEVCNGVDDNCNGKIDENVTRTCSTKCGTGKETCKFSNDGNTSNDWINCTAPKPGTESCNGKDDDCDGVTDNNLGTLGTCSIGGCKGQTKCVAGKLACDAKKPTMEVCDGVDNDCDTQVDENLSRPCKSICGPGVEKCTFTNDGNPNNDWVGCTAKLPGTESCNGVDDDCDGTVDEASAFSWSGSPCDHASGSTCSKGKLQCVGGVKTCVGAVPGTTEVCDCKDNDCDSQTDEGDVCPTGTKCVDCGCRIKCTGQEFGCPKGYSCKNGYCVPDKCADIHCKGDEKCVDGLCVSKCTGVTCSTGEVCKSGRCVENSCYGLGCPEGQICYQSKCVTPPCNGVTCQDGEYCAAGTCKKSCGPARCCNGGACQDGVCVTDPCAGVSCAVGIACRDGKCDTDCEQVTCAGGQVCRGGKCVDDPCKVVKCSGARETCKDGQCVSPDTFRGECTTMLASGGGGSTGCAMAPAGARSGGGGPPVSPGVTVLLLLGLVLAARRGDR